jgi:hypothetical protein
LQANFDYAQDAQSADSPRQVNTRSGMPHDIASTSGHIHQGIYSEVGPSRPRDTISEIKRKEAKDALSNGIISSARTTVNRRITDYGKRGMKEEQDYYKNFLNDIATISTFKNIAHDNIPNGQVKDAMRRIMEHEELSSSKSVNLPELVKVINEDTRIQAFLSSPD